MVAVASILVGMALLATLPSREVIDLLELHRHPYPATQYNGGHLLYRLFRPQQLDPEKKYPLIVWLHGYGKEEFEQIGKGMLRHTQLVFESRERALELEFFFLAVQCPLDQRGFFVTASTHSNAEAGAPPNIPGDATIAIIDELLAKHPIDSNRITLVGISGGGTACWELAIEHPARFAAVAPLASSGGDPASVAKLQGVAVWAFHAKDDPGTPTDGDIRSMTALQAAGGNAALTLIEGNDHDCWYFAFKDYRLLDWLLAQDRTALWSPPPGRVVRSWIELAVPAIFVALLFLAGWGEVRRRRQSNPGPARARADAAIS